jgi:hypothetical protein
LTFAPVEKDSSVDYLAKEILGHFWFKQNHAIKTAAERIIKKAPRTYLLTNSNSRWKIVEKQKKGSPQMW